jgi:hypothetical protein
MVGDAGTREPQDRHTCVIGAHGGCACAVSGSHSSETRLSNVAKQPRLLKRESHVWFGPTSRVSAVETGARQGPNSAPLLRSADCFQHQAHVEVLNDKTGCLCLGCVRMDWNETDDVKR